MTTSVVEGRVIAIGYEWRQRIEIVSTPGLFPSGCALTAHVRATRVSTAILATLTTGNGGIVRISDTAVEMVISPAQTAAMAPGRVVFDVVRTDPTPDQHLGFALTVPVIMSVTRGYRER